MNQKRNENLRREVERKSVRQQMSKEIWQTVLFYRVIKVNEILDPRKVANLSQLPLRSNFKLSGSF